MKIALHSSLLIAAGLLLILVLAGCSDSAPTSPEPRDAGPCLDKESCGDYPSMDPTDTRPGFSPAVRLRIPPRRKPDRRLDPDYLGPEVMGAPLPGFWAIRTHILTGVRV